jgi:hypothetical protein
VVVLVFGRSEDRCQVRTIDRFAFEEQVDDLVECVEMIADQLRGCDLGFS